MQFFKVTSICICLLPTFLNGADKIDVERISKDPKYAVKVAHILEKEPLRKDAEEARAKLFMRWYEQGIVEDDWCKPLLLESGIDSISSLLLVQGVLSGGAFKEEHPECYKDKLAIWKAGVEGAIRAYLNIIAIDPKLENAYYNKLVEMQRNSTLAGYIEQYAKACLEKQ